jgi:hypothetical protein
MAKRKRLTPANPEYLEGAGTIETKSMFPTGAPIADVARDAAAASAFEEMADTLARARTEGRMVLSVPLTAIQMDYLVRDRVVVNDDDMGALVASIRARGQQTPIELTDLGEGRFGLISGWRRCQALAQLAAETDGDQFGDVLALLRAPQQSSDAYIAMVEENEIRAGLSYYERARIVAKATEQGVFETRYAALSALFGSASRAKRSKIGSFVTLVEVLDGSLRFPGALGERLGLQLAKVLADDAQLAARLRRDLAEAAPVDATQEQAFLSDVLKSQEAGQKKTLTKKKKPVLKGVTDQIQPGLTLVQHADGSLTLKGKIVTAELREDLKIWLAGRA